MLMSTAQEAGQSASEKDEIPEAKREQHVRMAGVLRQLASAVNSAACCDSLHGAPLPPPFWCAVFTPSWHEGGHHCGYGRVRMCVCAQDGEQMCVYARESMP